MGKETVHLPLKKHLSSVSLTGYFTNWIKPAPGQEIYCLADREFGSKDWFGILIESKIHFCVRLKKNALLRTKPESKAVALYTLFENKSGFTSRAKLTFKQPVYVYGTCLYVSGHQLANGEYFIVGTDIYRRDWASIYQNRWQIETLFSAFKSRGFNLESCRVNAAKRTKTLLFVLAIGLIWAVQTGSWLIEQGKRIPMKKLKDGKKQKWKSIFRWGLDQLQNILLNNLDFKHVIDLCPV
ncbi:transposase [Cytophagaceae bacterium DM2B3-1]|uniref:Transposase n=1 Tax=Xanthocytophaga flava TaxID=3048013 RepID=A0ABT7CFD0_9BACT|nr:transposase [Xanthocytophaga flavus]MDJ1492450.1 transposase [Xanthocytophaga flavus]